jgi:hypothetical protein
VADQARDVLRQYPGVGEHRHEAVPHLPWRPPARVQSRSVHDPAERAADAVRIERRPGSRGEHERAPGGQTAEPVVVPRKRIHASLWEGLDRDRGVSTRSEPKAVVSTTGGMLLLGVPRLPLQDRIPRGPTGNGRDRPEAPRSAVFAPLSSTVRHYTTLIRGMILESLVRRCVMSPVAQAHLAQACPASPWGFVPLQRLTGVSPFDHHSSAAARTATSTTAGSNPAASIC